MSKIYKVLLEREKILVSVPMFWIEVSTGIIHQTDKNSDFTSEETKCLTNNFYSGRYISDGSLSKGTNTSQGQPNIFTLKLRFYNQHKEIDTSANPKSTIFRNGNKLSENDYSLSTKEKRPHFTSVSVSIEDASSFKKGVNQTYCVISIISNSSYTSTSVVSGKGCRIFIIIIFPRQLLISTDASLEGWKAFCQCQKTKGFF